MYTVFSLQEYFLGFWLIIAVHSLANILVKIATNKKFRSQNTSLLEKIFRRLFILATNEAAMLAGNDEMAAFLVQECSDLDWTITRPGMLDERPASAAGSA